MINIIMLIMRSVILLFIFIPLVLFASNLSSNNNSVHNSKMDINYFNRLESLENQILELTNMLDEAKQDIFETKIDNERYILDLNKTTEKMQEMVNDFQKLENENVSLRIELLHEKEQKDFFLHNIKNEYENKIREMQITFEKEREKILYELDFIREKKEKYKEKKEEDKNRISFLEDKIEFLQEKSKATQRDIMHLKSEKEKLEKYKSHFTSYHNKLWPILESNILNLDSKLDNIFALIENFPILKSIDHDVTNSGSVLESRDFLLTSLQNDIMLDKKEELGELNQNFYQSLAYENINFLQKEETPKIRMRENQNELLKLEDLISDKNKIILQQQDELLQKVIVIEELQVEKKEKDKVIQELLEIVKENYYFKHKLSREKEELVTELNILNIELEKLKKNSLINFI